MEIWHPERLFSPHRMTPQRCPDDVDVTVQPRASASASAFSTSFFGCLALILLTRYNNRRHAVHREVTEERALVYVSATRAKKELLVQELLVLSVGAPSRLLSHTRGRVSTVTVSTSRS